ncbi:MAG: hypothetical protein J7L07_05500 [Candidatus Odinarchaeota archaeon]|nr:hypothetical protein [Candidatus Odinarchaeota archaeon]
MGIEYSSMDEINLEANSKIKILEFSFKKVLVSQFPQGRPSEEGRRMPLGILLLVLSGIIGLIMLITLGIKFKTLKQCKMLFYSLNCNNNYS